jgi:prepilin-type N-terminal cleavage/methylation domain-containing protein
MRFSCINIFKNKSRAFTLIEIVVVIGIMALLTTIIYASFDGAKTQSRDQQRLTDISTIQLGLELYFNQHGSYPKVLMGDGTTPGLVVNVEGIKYLAEIPTPPSRSSEINYKYNYVPLTKTNSGERCISYHLWTTFEKSSANLESRKGFNSVFVGGVLDLPTDLYECGTGHNTTNASLNSLIYDVTP